MGELSQTISRRTALKGSAIVAGLGIGGGALAYQSTPVVAIQDEDLTFDDIGASVKDNDVTTVELDFGQVEIFYQDFDEPVDDADITIDVTVNDDEETSDEVLQVQQDPEDSDGNFTIEELLNGSGEDHTVDILAQDNIPDDSFDIPEGDNESITPVSVDIDVALTAGSETEETDADEAVDVTVDLKGDTEVGGEVESGDIES